VRSPIIEQLVAGRAPLVFTDLDVTSAGPWTESLTAHGYRAFAVLPLIVDGRVECAFSLYSEQGGFFDSEEMTLLVELAADNSLPLQSRRLVERHHYT